MIVISDTNILSSLAAGEALPALLELFASSALWIPPAVFQELQVGLDGGKTYLTSVFQVLADQQIAVVALSKDAEALLPHYPPRLNLGECQAIALAQTHKALLVSNDKRAIRYCQSQNLPVLNLENILRQLWVRKILTRTAVKQIIEQMARTEQLIIPPERQAEIFASSQSRQALGEQGQTQPRLQRFLHLGRHPTGSLRLQAGQPLGAGLGHRPISGQHRQTQRHCQRPQPAG